MANTIVFENEIQKILWENEICGQLSDGRWENARPWEHWEAWCDADVVVGENPGRDFSVKRDKYNLTDKILLEAMLYRMVLTVNLITINPDLVNCVSLPDSLDWFDNVERRAKVGTPWFSEAFAEWQKHGLTRELMVEAIKNPVVSPKEVVDQLKRMQQIMQIRIPNVRHEVEVA